MNIKCLFGHKWNGCYCSVCRQYRDAEHSWSNNCEKCSRCGTTRQRHHEWCECKCTVCGIKRDEGHDWSNNCEECSRCGVKRKVAHNWDGRRCKLCNIDRDKWVESQIQNEISNRNWEKVITFGSKAIKLLSNELELAKGLKRYKDVALALGRTGKAEAVPPLLSAIKKEIDQDIGYYTHEYKTAIVNIGKEAIDPLLLALKKEARKYRSDIAEILEKLSWVPSNEYDTMIFYAALGLFDRLQSATGYKSLKILMEYLPSTAKHIQDILESDADKVETDVLLMIVKLDRERMKVRHHVRCTDMDGDEYSYEYIDSHQMKHLAAEELKKRGVLN